MKLLATGVCNWDSPDILLDMNAEWLTECLKGAVTKTKTKVCLFNNSYNFNKTGFEDRLLKNSLFMQIIFVRETQFLVTISFVLKKKR